MTSGIQIENRFEIMAIMRECMVRKNNLELIDNRIKTLTKIEGLYSDCFIVKLDSLPPAYVIQSFILHSARGIINFKARYNPVLTSKFDCGIVYYLPEIVFLNQRRQYQRFLVNNRYNFQCFGLHRNGDDYSMQIRNISLGGCALSSKGSCASFIYKDSLIKGATLDFGSLGSLCLDLIVVHNSPTIELDDDRQPIDIEEVSCRFLFKRNSEVLALENIIVRLLTDCKIKDSSEK